MTDQQQQQLQSNSRAQFSKLKADLVDIDDDAPAQHDEIDEQLLQLRAAKEELEKLIQAAQNAKMHAESNARMKREQIILMKEKQVQQVKMMRMSQEGKSQLEEKRSANKEELLQLSKQKADLLMELRKYEELKPKLGEQARLKNVELQGLREKLKDLQSLAHSTLIAKEALYEKLEMMDIEIESLQQKHSSIMERAMPQVGQFDDREMKSEIDRLTFKTKALHDESMKLSDLLRDQTEEAHYAREQYLSVDKDYRDLKRELTALVSIVKQKEAQALREEEETKRLDEQLMELRRENAELQRKNQTERQERAQLEEEIKAKIRQIAVVKQMNAQLGEKLQQEDNMLIQSRQDRQGMLDKIREVDSKIPLLRSKLRTEEESKLSSQDEAMDKEEQLQDLRRKVADVLTNLQSEKIAPLKVSLAEEYWATNGKGAASQQQQQQQKPKKAEKFSILPVQKVNGDVDYGSMPTSGAASSHRKGAAFTSPKGTTGLHPYQQAPFQLANTKMSKGKGFTIDNSAAKRSRSTTSFNHTAPLMNSHQYSVSSPEPLPEIEKKPPRPVTMHGRIDMTAGGEELPSSLKRNGMKPMAKMNVDYESTNMGSPTSQGGSPVAAKSPTKSARFVAEEDLSQAPGMKWSPNMMSAARTIPETSTVTSIAGLRPLSAASRKKQQQKQQDSGMDESDIMAMQELNKRLEVMSSSETPATPIRSPPTASVHPSKAFGDVEVSNQAEISLLQSSTSAILHSGDHVPAASEDDDEQENEEFSDSVATATARLAHVGPYMGQKAYAGDHAVSRELKELIARMNAFSADVESGDDSRIDQRARVLDPRSGDKTRVYEADGIQPSLPEVANPFLAELHADKSIFAKVEEGREKNLLQTETDLQRANQPQEQSSSSPSKKEGGKKAVYRPVKEKLEAKNKPTDPMSPGDGKGGPLRGLRNAGLLDEKKKQAAADLKRRQQEERNEGPAGSLHDQIKNLKMFQVAHFNVEKELIRARQAKNDDWKKAPKDDNYGQQQQAAAGNLGYTTSAVGGASAFGRTLSPVDLVSKVERSSPEATNLSSTFDSTLSPGANVVSASVPQQLQQAYQLQQQQLQYLQQQQQQQQQQQPDTGIKPGVEGLANILEEGGPPASMANEMFSSLDSSRFENAFDTSSIKLSNQANQLEDQEEEEDGGGGRNLQSIAEYQSIFVKCRMNKYQEVEELLRRGCSVDIRDAFGNTPLIIAVQNGNKKLTKLLLRKGANLDAQNHRGNSALHYAFIYGYTALGEYLLAKGADDTLRNIKGKTCYEDTNND